MSGPFGAVKEQSSGLYAQAMAERDFLTIAFDPSFTGESGGSPRYVASPDINTEDFSAAVDFLSVQENVDPEKIGIIGICGWGGMAINAAAMDTRIKATAAMTMYDMTRVNANGYFDSEDTSDARFEKRKAMSAQRTVDYKTVHMPWPKVWSIRCRRTRPNSSRITTPTTKQSAAIIPVPSTPTAAGM